MYGAQNLKGTLWIGDRRIQERRLIGSTLLMGIARTGVPCSRHYYLIVHNLPVFNLDPMPQGTARRFMKSKTLADLGQLFGSHLSPLWRRTLPCAMLSSSCATQSESGRP